MMWKTYSWNVIMDSSDQLIHCEIYQIDGQFSHHLYVVYAHNQLVNRRKLCLDIKKCASNVKGPWMMIGDFNNVFIVADRIGSNDIHTAE